MQIHYNLELPNYWKSNYLLPAESVRPHAVEDELCLGSHGFQRCLVLHVAQDDVGRRRKVNVASVGLSLAQDNTEVCSAHSFRTDWIIVDDYVTNFCSGKKYNLPYSLTKRGKLVNKLQHKLISLSTGLCLKFRLNCWSQNAANMCAST